MADATNENQAVDVTDILLNPEVQTSLNTVLASLPQLASLMTALTKDEETITSLTALIEGLPSLTKLLNLVNRAYQGVEDVVTDGASLAGIANKVQGAAGPVVNAVQKGRDAFEVAKVRSEQDTRHYNVFAVLRMLKDPSVQKALRFTQAMLDALNEQKA